jgi:hypothetical protein
LACSCTRSAGRRKILISFDAIAEQNPDALIIDTNALLISQRKSIVEFAATLRIPVMAIGYSSRRRSLIPVIAIMAGRQEQGGHGGSAARRRWRTQRLQH